MSEWSRRSLSVHAAWEAHEQNPTNTAWANYAKLKRDLDTMGCCENMWVALSSDDIVKYGGGEYKIYGRPDVLSDHDAYRDNTDMYLISYCPFCGRKLQ